MAKVNSYSFGSLTKAGCVYDDLFTLHSLLCKVACVGLVMFRALYGVNCVVEFVVL